MNDDKNIFDDNTVDYSEGIGELLKDKNSYEFSWKKTGTVVLGLTVALAISVAAVSKIAKHLMIPAPDNYQSFEFSDDSHSHELADMTDTDEMDENTKSVIEEIVFSNNNTKAKNETKDEPKTIANSEPASSQKNSPQTAARSKSSNTLKVASQTATTTSAAVTTAPLKTSPKQSVTRSLSPDALYRVVIGQFADRQSANKIRQKLRLDKQSSYVWRTKEGSKDIFRVQVGAFSKEVSAKTLQTKLNQKGYSPYILHR